MLEIMGSQCQNLMNLMSEEVKQGVDRGGENPGRERERVYACDCKCAEF